MGKGIEVDREAEALFRRVSSMNLQQAMDFLVNECGYARTDMNPTTAREWIDAGLEPTQEIAFTKVLERKIQTPTPEPVMNKHQQRRWQ